jgi:hypothetical protein
LEAPLHFFPSTSANTSSAIWTAVLAAGTPLQQQFLNFVAGYFVIQRGSDVHPEFVAAIQGDHHRERYEAARIPREPGP